MRLKTLVVLLIILALLAGAGILMVRQKAPEESAKAMGSPFLKDLPAKEIASVTIHTPDSKVQLAIEAGRWVVKNRYGYPADFPRLSDLVQKLMNSKVGRKFDASPAVLNRLRLRRDDDKNASKDEKGTAIIFKDSKEKTVARVLLGKILKGGREGMFPEGQYVRMNDETVVYLIDKQFGTLDAQPSEWLKKDLLNVPSGDIREIRCVGPNGKTVLYAFKRPEKGKNLEPERLPPGKKIQESVLSQLAGALASLRIKDVADPRLDLSSAGMEHSPRLEYRLYDGLIYDIYPGGKCKGSGPCYLKVKVGYATIPPEQGKTSQRVPDGETKKKTEKPGEKDKALAQKAKNLDQRLSPWVYVIPQWEHGNFVTNLSSLLEKEGKKDKG